VVDPSENHRNTSKRFNAQPREELSSAYAEQTRNLMKKPSLVPTEPLYLPDPPNGSLVENTTNEEWLEGLRHFSEAIWISSPSTILACSIR
jgi:hypothetical protein